LIDDEENTGKEKKEWSKLLNFASNFLTFMHVRKVWRKGFGILGTR
jgi:hypothetical protein